MIRIASFDIGKKNFAFYVEDCDVNVLKSLRRKYLRLPKKLQRRMKGPMNNEVSDILTNIYKSSVRVDMGVFDIRENKDSDELDIKTRINMHTLLEKYSDLWNTCNVIIIEQQYFNISNGKRGKASCANVDAIKLGECCINWFLFNYAEFKEILYFSSVFKTHSLGAPDKLTKPQRKKWSIEKGKDIFELRGDKTGLDILSNYKNAKGKKQKLDDVFDCVIMTQAYKFTRLVI